VDLFFNLVKCKVFAGGFWKVTKNIKTVKTKLYALFIGLCAVLFGVPVSAQNNLYEGITKVDLPPDLGRTDGTVSLYGVRLKWSYWTIAGEPVYSLTGDYSLAGGNMHAASRHFLVCADKGHINSDGSVGISSSMMPPSRWPERDGVELLSTSRFRLFVRENIYMEAMADALVRRLTDLAFEEPEGPNWHKTGWDRIFKVGFGRPDDPWLPAEEAKKIFRINASVERIAFARPRFNMQNLIRTYNDYIRETCTSGTHPKERPDPDEDLRAAASESAKAGRIGSTLDMSGFGKKTPANSSTNTAATKSTRRAMLDMSAFNKPKEKPASPAGEKTAQNPTSLADKPASGSSQIPAGYEKLIGKWMYREVKEIGSDYWGTLYQATYWEFHENQKFIWYSVGLVGPNKGKITSSVEAAWSISGNELVLTLEDGKTVANKSHIISVDDQVLEITTKYTNGTRGYRLISEKHPKFHDYLSR